MSGNKRKRNKPVETEMDMLLFSNNPNPIQYNLLEMFYRGVLQNTLGLMEARNVETGELDLLLVGLDKEGEEIKTYPLAVLIKKDAGKTYLAPDGLGNYR